MTTVPQELRIVPSRAAVDTGCDLLVSRSGIWTVATIGIRHQRTEARAWGYFLTEAEAIAGMHRCCESEGGYYTHAVVENFQPGIYAMADKEVWFRWDDGWKQCDKPESESHIVNYGMG